jgi:DnaK suppressor protein
MAARKKAKKKAKPKRKARPKPKKKAKPKPKKKAKPKPKKKAKPKAKKKARPKPKKKAKPKPKKKARPKPKKKARPKPKKKAKPKPKKKARPKPKKKAKPKKARPKPAAKPKAAKTKPRRSRGVTATIRFAEEEPEVKKPPPVKRKKLPKKISREFLAILEEKRQRILRKARTTIEEGMKFDEADLPDEYDQATSEYLQYFTLRLRGREKYFLDKIEQAIGRIKDGSFGYCDSCGVQIGMNRLKARPETTLCIRCKEAQEREERQFGE